MQPEIPFLPVFSSMKRLIRYSLGSIALGSLILSFVESIRFMLESIRRKLKVSGTTPDNWFGKVAFHISRFCLRCADWTIRSVNRNAYIMVILEIIILAAFAFMLIQIHQYPYLTKLIDKQACSNSITSSCMSETNLFFKEILHSPNYFQLLVI